MNGPTTASSSAEAGVDGTVGDVAAVPATRSIVVLRPADPPSSGSFIFQHHEVVALVRAGRRGEAGQVVRRVDSACVAALVRRVVALHDRVPPAATSTLMFAPAPRCDTFRCVGRFTPSVRSSAAR